MNTKNLALKLNKNGFYYGWIVAVVGTIGVVMSVPGQTMGVSVFTEYLIQALEIDRTQLSLAYMFGTLSSALLLPYAGKILDKVGARVLAGLAAFGLGCFLIILAKSPTITLYLSSIVKIDKSWIALTVAFLCFIGIRHFGQGQLTMSSRTMMGLWFEKKRGLVLGISGAVVSLCFGMAPVVLTGLITKHGWQEALYILATASFIMSTIAWLFYKRSPEHSGLKLDGGSLDDKISEDEVVLNEENIFTAKQARQTYTFWVFNLAMAANATLVTAMTFHLTDIGKVSGIDSVKAFSVYVPASATAIVVELTSGYLSDKVRIKYLLALMQFSLCAGFLGLLWFDTSIGFYTVAIGLGTSGGLFALLNSVAWPKLFGRTYLGSIMGVVTSCMVAGSAIGPYLFSLGRSIHGNYEMVVMLAAIIPGSIFIAAFFARNPRRKS